MIPPSGKADQPSVVRGKPAGMRGLRWDGEEDPTHARKLIKWFALWKLFTFRARGPNRGSRAPDLHAFGQVCGAARDDERRRGVQEHRVAVGRGLPREERAEGAAVLLGRAAEDRLEGMDGQARVLGVQFELGTIAVLEPRRHG
jgi:hypothetical protein